MTDTTTGPASGAPSGGGDLRRLLAAAWPLIAINLAITGMQFADALMVAPLGEGALAAIFPAFMLFLVPVVFGHGLLAVVTSFAAQHVGAGQARRAGAYGRAGVAAAVVWGLLLQPLGLAAPRFFAWMGHAPEVQAMEVAYYRWLLPSAVPSLVVVALSAFFVGLLRTRLLVVAAALATVLNVFFNWVFIYGQAGFPRMGVAGAALGTALAATGQAVFLWVAFRRPALRAELGTGGWRVERRAWRDIWRVGAPAGGLPVLDLFAWGVITTWMIGLFGTAHLAANTIVIRYLHLSFMPSLAVGSALTAMVGEAIGAGRREVARARAFLAYRLLGSYMVAVGLLFLAFRGPLLRLFSADPEVVAVGRAVFVCTAVYQAFDAMYLTFSHALRGAGDTWWPSLAVLVLSSTVLVGGGLAFVTWWPELGSLGPWIATTAYATVLGLAMTWRWYHGRWERIRLTG